MDNWFIFQYRRKTAKTETVVAKGMCGSLKPTGQESRREPTHIGIVSEVETQKGR